MYKVLLFFILFAFNSLSQADCQNLQPICSDNGFSFQIGTNSPNNLVNDLPTGLNVSNPGPGQGPNNGNPNTGGCLNSNELNPVWLLITIQTTGQLEFAIGQSGGNGFYDWAMWPYYDNGSTSACDDIRNNILAPVACNWNQVQDTYTGMTVQGFLPPGANSGNFEYALNVNAGDQFVICFSNYSGLNGVNVPISFGNDIPGNNNPNTSSVTCDPNISNQTICIGDTANVNVNASGILNPTFNWLVTTNVSDPTSGTNVQVNPSLTTDYQVQVLENGTPVDTAEFTITVLTPGNPNAGADQNVCLGNPIQLNGTVGNNNNDSLWIPLTNQVSPTPNVQFSPGTSSLNPSVTVNQVGVYQFILQEGNSVCGYVQDTVDVIVEDIQFTVNQQIPSCVDSSDAEIHVDSPNATLFSFDNAATWQVDSFAIGFSAGSYDVCVKSALGCQTCSQVVVVDPNPTTITASNDTLICQNGTANLSASAQVGTSFNYHWSHVSGLGPNQTCSPSADTWYYVHATNEKGCPSESDSIYVTLRDPLNATISPFDTICPGYTTNVTSEVSGGIGSPYQFDWTNIGVHSTGGTDLIVANPTQTQIYEVTISDNCETTPVTLSSEIFVAPLPVPKIEVLNPYQCEPAIFDVVNKTDPLLSQNTFWEVVNKTYSNQDTITTDTFNAGTYGIKLTVSTPQGCVDSTYFDSILVVRPKPKAYFNYSPNPVKQFNAQAYFYDASEGAKLYEWNFEQGSPSYSYDETEKVTFPDGETGDYDITLIVTSDLGCTDTITRVLTVFPEVLMFVPNSFTPNGDQFNNIWKISMQGLDFTGFNLLIFDRWGKIVWESHDVNIGWDGTYNGELLPTGTYSWKLTAKDAVSDQKYNYSGHINLLR